MSDAASALAGLLGDDAVSTEPDDLAAHATDWSPASFVERRVGTPAHAPSCVVRPRSTDQVAKVLRWAQETATPVVPYGGGSSVVEGIRPAGAVVLDTGSLRALGEVDRKSGLIEVGAGVYGPALEAHLGDAGFTLGHEPQSHALSTVGGWIATKACGQLSSAYGGIEDRVAGMEAVLPGGTVVRSTVAPRRSVGPDVASLMIGSEGTLGVVTSATLRVSPARGERSDLCLRFDDMASGVGAARTIAQAGLRPTFLRLYDAEDAALFLRHHPEEGQGPLMICSFHGGFASDRRATAASLPGAAAGNDALVAHWWEHRNDAVHEFRNVMEGDGLLGPHGVVDTIEVSARWSVLRDVYHGIKDELGQRSDLVGCHIGHIYPDGACLYFTIAAVTGSDRDAAARIEAWWTAAMETCLAAGGSISHHHGIGRTKAPWLRRELGGWWDVLVAVKRAIDPMNIMNPGALGL